jgi:hypothetical protein
MRRVRALAGIAAIIAVVTSATCEETTAPDTCVQGRTMTIGVDVTETVAGGDCALDGRHVDSYQFTLASQATIRFNINAQTGTDIRVRDNGKSGDQEIVLHDNDQTQYATFATLPAGSYTLDVAASEDGDDGTYTIASTALESPAPIGCLTPPGQIRFAAIGVQAGGTITGGDCPGAPTFFHDDYNVRFAAGGVRKITVSASAGFAIEVRVKDASPLVTQPVSRNTAGESVVQFSPTATAYYSIAVIAAPGSGAITYTIRIE